MHTARVAYLTTFDIEPLEQWVEKGVAPERVNASHVTNGAVDCTRPLCPHPQECPVKAPVHHDAANFVCAISR